MEVSTFALRSERRPETDIKPRHFNLAEVPSALQGRSRPPEADHKLARLHQGHTDRDSSPPGLYRLASHKLRSASAPLALYVDTVEECVEPDTDGKQRGKPEKLNKQGAIATRPSSIRRQSDIAPS